MKTKLQVGATGLWIVTTAILGTIYLAWLLYPLEIQWLHLEKVVYLEAATIEHNFHILMQYLTNPLVWKLDMPNFSSSSDGLHHFLDVKYLFHLVQVLWGFSLPFAWLSLRRRLGVLYRSVYIWMVILPLVVAGIGVLIGFDQFFVLFHQLLFPGDSSWLFDPNTDPVIYILPQEFFLHCFLLFFALYEGLCLFFLFFSHLQEKKRKK